MSSRDKRNNESRCRVIFKYSKGGQVAQNFKMLKAPAQSRFSKTTHIHRQNRLKLHQPQPKIPPPSGLPQRHQKEPSRIFSPLASPTASTDPSASIISHQTIVSTSVLTLQHSTAFVAPRRQGLSTSCATCVSHWSRVGRLICLLFRIFALSPLIFGRGDRHSRTEAIEDGGSRQRRFWLPWDWWWRRRRESRWR